MLPARCELFSLKISTGDVHGHSTDTATKSKSYAKLWKLWKSSTNSTTCVDGPVLRGGHRSDGVRIFDSCRTGSRLVRWYSPFGHAAAAQHWALPSFDSISRKESKWAVWTFVIVLGACAATSPTLHATAAPNSGNPDLACLLPGNCVSSLGYNGLPPLLCAGTPEQAMAMLQATLLTFPEATIVRSEPLMMEVIFTAPVGVRDQADLRIGPQAQRVDFRSRSLFGLFDWGKHRSDAGIQDPGRTASPPVIARNLKRMST